ncbi:MAG: DUF1501 domain-containing protein [Bacteroidetes bacterium]|nr:MAG: DUF1501 domain-containing protein [Bacteroidota bacterium]
MNNRRDFLKLSALASASVLMPGFLQGLGKDSLDYTGKKLVIVQLSGGNDGLNSFVPYRNDAYYKARPSLAIPAREVLTLNDELGLNPVMPELKALYEEGQLCIINNVGYPNPDRSHFRSMDIWHTASNSDEYWQSGWLGRYLDNSCAGCAKPHQVLELDDTLSLAVKGEQLKALAVRDPNRLYRQTRDPFLAAMMEAYNSHAPSAQDELDYMYKTIAETTSSAAYLHEHARVYTSRLDYPQGPFGRQLKTVAELICAGMETSVYYVSLTGFDTHVRQKPQQERLLKQYSQGMATFIRDLRQNDRLNETLIMTFSEFGRRVSENASGGTDHGKANQVLLMGGQLGKPGVFNPAPNLAQLDEGDLPFEIDFRQIYASLLHHWLEANDELILKRTFKRLDLF